MAANRTEGVVADAGMARRPSGALVPGPPGPVCPQRADAFGRAGRADCRKHRRVRLDQSGFG